MEDTRSAPRAGAISRRTVLRLGSAAAAGAAAGPFVFTPARAQGFNWKRFQGKELFFLFYKHPWVDEMVTSILNGRIGYCEHAAMAEHSDETRELLARLFRIADAARGVQVSDTDVVHFDFSPYNVLTDGARASGVVAWLMLTASVLWGVVLSTKAFPGHRRPA